MPIVLVVSESPQRSGAWTLALAAEGFTVITCPGPTGYPCPRLGAAPCPQRERADVAIVEIQGPDTEPYGEWGERACVRIPDDGRTIFVSREGGPGRHGAHLTHPVRPDDLVDAARRLISDPPLEPSPNEHHAGSSSKAGIPLR